MRVWVVQTANRPSLRGCAAKEHAVSGRAFDTPRQRPQHQRVGNRREVEPHLVGTQGGGAGAIGKQRELLLLDAVLHVAARTVHQLVEQLAGMGGGREVGDDEARVRPGRGGPPPCQSPGARGSRSRASDRRTRETAAPRAASRHTAAAPAPAPAGAPVPGAHCAPSPPRRTPPSALRTTPAAARDKNRCRRAPRSSPPASAPGSASPAAPPPRRLPPPPRGRPSAAAPPTGARRRRCTAADSSSGRSSRGRTAPPAARGPDHRWRPHRE